MLMWPFRIRPPQNWIGKGFASSGAEVLFEDFAGELLDGFSFLPGGFAQGEETLLIDLDLEMTPLDVHVELGRFQGLLIVGDAVRIPEFRRLPLGAELVRQRTDQSIHIRHDSQGVRRTPHLLPILRFSSRFYAMVLTWG